MTAMDELLPIGRFARLSGLSVGALRHYAELDLVRPADVDASTGYRRYRRSQLEVARLVVRLRDLEMPLEEIRAVLSADDPVHQRRIVEAHRRRVEARTFRLQGVLHALRRATDGKEPLMSTPAAPPALDEDQRRAVATGLFNHVWTLLENPSRTTAQDDAMIHAAHASRYHWGEVGTPANVARGEWLCSRVYAVLGRAEPALHHARRCLELNEANPDREDWELASAYEAHARAHAVAGDLDARDAWRARAEAELAGIADPDDRHVIESDVASLP